jgi:hypothetical protein
MFGPGKATWRLSKKVLLACDVLPVAPPMTSGPVERTASAPQLRPTVMLGTATQEDAAGTTMVAVVAVSPDSVHPPATKI